MSIDLVKSMWLKCEERWNIYQLLIDQGHTEGFGGWLEVLSIYCLILLLVVEGDKL